MSNKDMPVLDLFKEKAKAISVVLAEAATMREAMEYALDVCEKKESCEFLFSGCNDPLSTDGQVYCQRHDGRKIFAAPALADGDFDELAKKGGEKGFNVLKDGMRGNLPGIDVAFTVADMAIAETATCVLQSASEELRIATMICEEHVIVLPKSKVVRSSYDAEAWLHGLMSNGAMYTAFISGASRTSDIERVLTLGVHGPLVLHVVLLEG